MCEVTTILLGVRRGINLHTIFEEIGFPADFPMDFFEFSNDLNALEHFFKIQRVNLEYFSPPGLFSSPNNFRESLLIYLFIKAGVFVKR